MLDYIQRDLVAAMKAGDRVTTDALKMLKSALTNARIATSSELTDDDVIRVIRKEMKARADARDMYKQHGRDDQAAKEEAERALYERYVPTQMDASAIDTEIARVASSSGSSTFSELMPKIMTALADKADGKLVAERVKAYLEER